MGPFENSEKMVEKIAGQMGLSDKEKKLLLTHKHIMHSELEVNGKKYPAWRAVHSNALGPGKGGIRFHPEVSESEIKALSFWMSIKNSLAGLPYGGGKGGVKFNPKEVSEEEMEGISRAFVQAFHEKLGENKDIPAPDVYTTGQIMIWMLDEFEKITGKKEPAMITGKPLALGGIALREIATAKGGFIVTKRLMEKDGLTPEGTTVAVQGFGNAGYFMAKFLREDGFTVVAVSDSKGGIHNKDGLDIAKVKETKDSAGSVTNFEGVEKISNEDLLELDVDILVPAALENVITEENAGKIKAKYIIELANGPVTPEADEILFKNGIHVAPDVLANAGGVVVSFFEWVQNKVGNFFEDQVLENKLHHIMTTSTDRVTDLAAKKNIDLRCAAYAIGAKRILEAERLRGNLK